jgi:DNA-binding NarL/FixJ family response regulator
LSAANRSSSAFLFDGVRPTEDPADTEGEPCPKGLSERELQVVGLALAGHTNKVIAWQLGLRPDTVRVHIWRAGEKLGVHGRNAILARMSALGFLPSGAP